VRVIFSFAFIAVLLWVRRDTEWIRPLLVDRRRLLLVLAASALIAMNWGAFIFSVLSGQVLQSSFGYFIVPLVSILLGIIVLGERLQPVQWVGLGLGTVAVLVLGLGYGSLPWLALTLAGSFGLYGLVKKQLGMAAAPSLAAETLVLLPAAAGYLGWLLTTGAASLIGPAAGPLAILGPGPARVAHLVVMIGSGVVTAVPLLMFTGAATRVPLSWMGPISYLTPTLQFLLALTLFQEEMSASRWVGFGLVWLGLGLLAVDTTLRAHQRRGAPRDSRGQLSRSG